MHSKCSPAFSRVNCVSSSVKKKTAGKQQHKGGGSCLASNKFVCFGAHYSFFCKHGSHAFATFSILSRKKNHSFIVEKSGLLYLPFFWKKLTRLGMGGGGRLRAICSRFMFPALGKRNLSHLLSPRRGRKRWIALFCSRVIVF